MNRPFFGEVLEKDTVCIGFRKHRSQLYHSFPLCSRHSTKAFPCALGTVQIHDSEAVRICPRFSGRTPIGKHRGKLGAAAFGLTRGGKRRTARGPAPRFPLHFTQTYKTFLKVLIGWKHQTVARGDLSGLSSHVLGCTCSVGGFWIE